MKISTKVIAIIQVRLDSSRLPRKALKKIGSLALIEIVSKRVLRIKGVDSVILATSERAVDDELVTAAANLGIKIYRGSTNDVAGRLLNCAKSYNADYFIRVNGDSPFFDYQFASQYMDKIKLEQYDLITNIPGRTFPYGIAFEAIKTKTFEKYHQFMDEQQKEHVTLYFYDNLDWLRSEIRVKEISSQPQNQSTSERFVIDTPEDFERYQKLYEHLGDELYSIPYTELVKTNY